MNETLLQNITRAIRGNRPALQAVLEQYKGLAYAMAFRKVRRFPEAQQIAQRAWIGLSVKIRKLRSPEDFFGLLGTCISDAQLDLPSRAAIPDPGEEHSVMKTEKVLARKALRQAFQDFDFPEAQIFFLRFVESVQPADSAQLLGIETADAERAIKKSLVILAFRAGFAGPELKTCDPATIAPGRLDLLMTSIDQAENRGKLTPEMEEQLKQDAGLRKELDAVKQVLSLTSATFGVHRLPPEFVRETLSQIALPEPAPLPTYAAAVTPRAPAAPAQQQVRPSSWPLFIPGFIIGMIATAIGVSILGIIAQTQAWYAVGTSMYVAAPYYILVWGLGISMGLYARPPIFARKMHYPGYYYLLFGTFWGSAIIQAYFLLGMGSGITSLHVTTEIVGPAWLIMAMCLVFHRIYIEQRLLENWMEESIRVMQQTDLSAPKTPVTPAAETPPIPDKNPA